MKIKCGCTKPKVYKNYTLSFTPLIHCRKCRGTGYKILPILKIFLKEKQNET